MKSLLLLASLGSVVSLSAQPTVSSVTAHQRQGTKLVDISYNLGMTNPDLSTVNIKASRDGGNRLEAVPLSSLSGAVGDGQTAGNGKNIVWDAGAHGWEAALYPEVKVRVEARLSSFNDNIETLSINTNPNEPRAVTVESESEVISLYGVKNELGELVQLRQVVYANLEGNVMITDFGDDGFPISLTHQGWLYLYSNWTETTVDLAIFSPDGDEELFIAGAEIDPGAIEWFGLANQFSQSAASGTSVTFLGDDSIMPRDVVSGGLRFAGYTIKVAGYAKSITTCGLSVKASVVTAGLATPLAIYECGSLAKKIVVDLSGSEDLQEANLVFDASLCVSGGRGCPDVLMGLAQDALFAAADARDARLAEIGTIRGLVRDADTREPIADAVIFARTILADGSTTVASERTRSNGSYSIRVQGNRPVYLVVTKSGYQEQAYQNASVEGGTTRDIETLLTLSDTLEGPGNLAGQVTDSVTGNAITDVNILFRVGQNNRTGAVVAEINTDSGGNYSLSLDGEIYTASFQREGYAPGFLTVTSISGQTRGNQNISLTPALATGVFQAVLTWGENPRDLDSHLTGPAVIGGNFHVYFSSRGSATSEPFSELDRDDTSSFGPETITITQRRNGVYRYFVHDYTNRSSSTNTGLANSSAEVRVVGEQGTIQTFSVPSGIGTLWTVFEIDGITGAITPINTLSNVSDPSAVSNLGGNSSFSAVPAFAPITAEQAYGVGEVIPANALQMQSQLEIAFADSNIFSLDLRDFVVTEPTINSQTGLYEQRVTLTNTSGVRRGNFRIYVDDLPPGISLYNAHGTENGRPYVDVDTPLDPNASITLRLEYYDPSRGGLTTPTLSITDSAGEGVNIDPAGAVGLAPRLSFAENGDVLIEFDSNLGATYHMQYSDDLSSWETVRSPISGTGSKTQWIDNGPPKTNCHPKGCPVRYYRLIESGTSD